MTVAEALAWTVSWGELWAAETGAGWAIEMDGVLAGRVDLHTVNLAEGHGEAAYWVRPHVRGRGVAPRALDALAEWAFTQIGLHRIDLEHSTANPASCRVAVKAHFQAEGIKRSSVLHADGWHDMHLHARLTY
jgi:RimJ/RimL family protein N-acetyltransferase